MWGKNNNVDVFNSGNMNLQSVIAFAAKTQLNTFTSLSHPEKHVTWLLSLYLYDNEEIGKDNLD